MKIIPAIDLIDGKCVRLLQGDYSKKTIYNDNALEVAKSFIDAGAELVHVVDLDGAKAGKVINIDVIKTLTSNNIPIEVGGGIRTMDSIDLLLNLGVKRVILGSVALTNKELLKEALNKYGNEKIVLGLDCKNGYVAIKGWIEESKVKAIDILNEFKSFNGKYVIYTDISKDGMMLGCNIDELNALTNEGLHIVASGGVCSIDDVVNCKKIGCGSAIIGKAIYTNAIDLKEAINYAR